MATPEVPRRDLAGQGGGRVTSGPSEVAQGPTWALGGWWRGAVHSRARPSFVGGGVSPAVPTVFF